jgi:glycosyltransferase involved in cell wall biosynthesis
MEGNNGNRSELTVDLNESQHISDKSRPLLSIIIPTRNRVEYAVSAINSILKIESDLFELVVQDNSESDALGRYLASEISDKRLKYNYIRVRLDVVSNFNIGLELATGDYFTFLGDDDGVNPEILDAVIWAKLNDVDAISTPFITDYKWPDLRQKYYGDKDSGSLKIKPFTGEVTFQDVEKGMFECARHACQNLVSFVGLPKIYYGIVKRECMEKVRDKTGTYFPGISPDLSGAMAVANYVRRLYSIDYPLFIPGSSAKSAAGISAQKRHHGRKLQDQPHLPEGCWNNWPVVVPEFYAVQTVWAQAGWSALKATGRDDILEAFNVPLLHAMCAVFNPQYFIFILTSYFKALDSSDKGAIWGAINFSRYYLFVWGLRAKSILDRLFYKIKPEKTKVVSNLNNIEEATQAFVDLLAKEGSQLKNILRQYDGPPVSG